MFTAAEFALIARRHMHLYGTTPEQLATVAATIRNNGHVNPEAVYYGRGPFTAQDILDSRMVADPYHLLDCAMTSEGGCALVLTAPTCARPAQAAGVHARRRHRPLRPVVPAPAGVRPRRATPARSHQRLRRPAAPRETAFAMAGLGPDDVDVCEFYDPFCFEIIRQFEAFGFCGEGEGGDFVMDGTIEAGGRYPITTDGGLMSFSHGGATVQLLQRVIRAVQQVRGDCRDQQVAGAEVALCTNGGAGALFTDVMLLGKEPP